MDMAERTRAMVEVRAGVIPGVAETELCRMYALTAADWEQKGEQGLLDLWTQALSYATSLVVPQRTNWVHVDWVWL